MLYSALAFLAGISAFQCVDSVPPASAWWLVLLLPLSVSTWRPLRLAGLVLAGSLWAWWHAAQVLEIQLPAHLEGEELAIQGRVTGLPEKFADGSIRFRFTIERYLAADAWQAIQLPVRLAWYRDAPQLEPGQAWSLRVKLKRPRGLANPGGFDAARWLFAQRIRATGYVRRTDSNRLLDARHGESIARARAWVTRQISSRISDAALLNALSVGVRHGISNEQWRVLRRTGTSHLIAISGLHVGLVASLVFFLTRRVWGRYGATESWPAPRMAAVVAMGAALAYALLAGFEVPAQRAAIMVCVWTMAGLGSTRPDPWQVWAIALWIVLLLNPLSVLGAGFWLSFGAVAMLVYLHAGRYGPVTVWRRVAGLQTALIIGLTPILWLCFHQVSLVAPLANLLAIPWITLLVVPVLLAAVLLLPLIPRLAELLLIVADAALGLLWSILEWLASLPSSALELPDLPVLVPLLTGTGLLCLLAVGAIPLRLLGVALLVPALGTGPERPQSGDLWFTLLDVGQGLAATVATRHHLLVYDTGPGRAGGYNSGDAVVAPFLTGQGYRQIDRLVISHGDNDHSGGGAALFARLDVLSLHSGEPQALGWARAQRCAPGMQWVWDEVRFEYLAPLERHDGNNASCVLRIQTRDGRVVLLPGDIERGVERELLAAGAEQLAATVLVAPHHGSRTSSTSAFVEAVRPDYVLFSTGYRNRFGFPRPQVYQRYRENGAIAFDTARQGAIRLRLEAGKPVAVSGYRDHNRRYWH